MDTEAQLDRLKQHNPFASSSVGDPWDHPYPHVPSINEQAFEGLCHLMAQKAHDPALNCAALILGEVGSGKTHLLGRILAHATHAQPPFTFAYIQPIEDPEQTYRYLLREVIVNMCRPAHATPYATQLEAILAAICFDVIHRHSRPQGTDKLQTIQREDRNVLTFLRPPVFAYAQQWAIDLLCRDDPGMSTRFLNVLFQYHLPEQRAAAVNWLKGDALDTADASRLGVPERFHASSTQLEQEARDILVSLGLVLARYRQPLMLCFDRLENLETEAQIHAFGKMVEFLVDITKGILPMACARGQQWEERLRRILNQHVSSRLETNTFTLRGCTAEQALALVRSRLASVLDAASAETVFPFDAGELQQMFQGRFHSPRVVISRVNERLQQIVNAGFTTPALPHQILQKAFDHQVRSILKDFDRYPPDRDRLRRALGLYLSYSSPHNRSRLTSVKRPDGTENKYIDLIGTIHAGSTTLVPVTILIDVAQHHNAVGACLNRSIACLETCSGPVIYVRDARYPIKPEWQANEILTRFKVLSGHVIMLDREHAARWYALDLLYSAVRADDITLITSEQELRPISQDEFAAFIQLAFDDSAFDAIEAALAPSERFSTP